MAKEIAKWVNVLATKPDVLSSIPRTPIVERENRLPQVILWPPHTLQHTWPYTNHVHANIQYTNKSKIYRKYPKLLKGVAPCNSELKQIGRELSEQVQCLLNPPSQYYPHHSNSQHFHSKICFPPWHSSADPWRYPTTTILCVFVL